MGVNITYVLYVLTAVRSHAYILTLHTKIVQDECVNECIN